jgi:hypothetical protein
MVMLPSAPPPPPKREQPTACASSSTTVSDRVARWEQQRLQPRTPKGTTLAAPPGGSRRAESSSNAQLSIAQEWSRPHTRIDRSRRAGLGQRHGQTPSRAPVSPTGQGTLLGHSQHWGALQLSRPSTVALADGGMQAAQSCNPPTPSRAPQCFFPTKLSSTKQVCQSAIVRPLSSASMSSILLATADSPLPQALCSADGPSSATTMWNVARLVWGAVCGLCPCVCVGLSNKVAPPCGERSCTRSPSRVGGWAHTGLLLRCSSTRFRNHHSFPGIRLACTTLGCSGVSSRVCSCFEQPQRRHFGHTPP